MVKKVLPDGSRTIYIGGVYEVKKNASGSVIGSTMYYAAAGAMRVVTDTNVAVYYILGNQLGSTSVVIDASGVKKGEQRYYPFGKTRSTTGTLYTDRLFTGQQEISGLGLYNYKARFYDPALGRFITPDTVTPGEPQGLNRYSYVGNNPINYADPSGHRPCENGDCEIDPLLYKITYDVGWDLQGNNWTEAELQRILSTGRQIKNKIDWLTGGKGQARMDNYLGQVNLAHTPWYLKPDRDRTFPGWAAGGVNSIYLFPGWINQDGGNRWLAHEMGHIWDMKTAKVTGLIGSIGGVADDLSTYLNGNPSGFRYINVYPDNPKVPQNYLFVGYTYGNTSTADFLAESFSSMIYHPEYFPPGLNQEIWVATTIQWESYLLP
jgi:RHS repeat-associated protein